MALLLESAETNECEVSLPSIKPSIAELVRTGYCVPGIILKVTRISSEPLFGTARALAAYRLVLTDGRYHIQGMVYDLPSLSSYEHSSDS